jgi:hypothetical protein
MTGDDTVLMTLGTLFSILWSPSGLDTTGDAGRRHVKLILNIRQKTKNSGLLWNTLLHTEEVLLEILTYRNLLDIKITGLETGSRLSLPRFCNWLFQYK